MIVSVDHEVVVTGVITGRTCVFLHIVLTALIHLLDNGFGLFRSDVIFLHHSLYAALHGSLDQDAQMVGMIAENIEAATTGDDA